MATVSTRGRKPRTADDAGIMIGKLRVARFDPLNFCIERTDLPAGPARDNARLYYPTLKDALKAAVNMGVGDGRTDALNTLKRIEAIEKKIDSLEVG